ncbi:hypothetical protein D3C73_673520 [compost metagenome]
MKFKGNLGDRLFVQYKPLFDFLYFSVLEEGNWTMSGVGFDFVIQLIAVYF